MLTVASISTRFNVVDGIGAPSGERGTGAVGSLSYLLIRKVVPPLAGKCLVTAANLCIKRGVRTANNTSSAVCSTSGGRLFGLFIAIVSPYKRMQEMFIIVQAMTLLTSDRR